MSQNVISIPALPVNLSIASVTPDMSHDIAVMTGELLEEIMATIGQRAFNFVLADADARLKKFIAAGKYHVFAAFVAEPQPVAAGFISLAENYSIYAEGAFGIIPELYVRPAYRQNGAGTALLASARDFGKQRGWTRLEVTTPPIPQFQRTLDFYEREGFTISGGRKLQTGL